MALSLILFFLLMFIESNILFISTTDKTTYFFAFLGKIKSFDGSDFISSLLIKYLKKISV